MEDFKEVNKALKVQSFKHMLHSFKQWVIIVGFAAVRATPGLKMTKLLTASNAKRSFPSHAGRWGPSLKDDLFMGILGNCLCLRCSTTVGTVETSTAAVVPVTSWRCPPTPDPCGCATCVTPCYYSGAPLVLPDTSELLLWELILLTCEGNSALTSGAYLGHTNIFIRCWEGFVWLITILETEYLSCSWGLFLWLLYWWHAFCYCHLFQ